PSSRDHGDLAATIPGRPLVPRAAPTTATSTWYRQRRLGEARDGEDGAAREGRRARATGASMTAHELIASYYTLTGTPVGQPPRFSFDDRVGAAARAGFTGIGLLADDYAALRASGQSDADLLDVLDRHGVGVLEVEFLFD